MDVNFFSILNNNKNGVHYLKRKIFRYFLKIFTRRQTFKSDTGVCLCGELRAIDGIFSVCFLTKIPLFIFRPFLVKKKHFNLVGRFIH